MIGSVRGTIVDRSAKGEVIVETASGVGYKLLVSATTLAMLGTSNAEQVFLHVHTHVREDALQLFGFASREERVTFELLISTHGVGPSLALAVLSAHSPASLRAAVETENADALTLVPGVGKKTAARLLIELKSKFENAELDLPVTLVTAGAPGSGTAQAVGSDSDARADVRAALSELGYGTDEVRAVLRRLPAEGESGALLKKALVLLAQGVRA